MVLWLVRCFRNWVSTRVKYMDASNSFDMAQRIAVLFHRRGSWSEKESHQYNKLLKARAFNDEDFTLIEGYYASERAKKDGIHRRDLYTFLNNYPGEVDRATAWSEGQHRNNRKSLDKERQKQHPVSNEEFQRISDLAKKEMERFKLEFKR